MGVDRVIPSGSLGSVVICAELSDKDLHRQVVLDRVMASGSPWVLMVSTQVQSAKVCIRVLF